LAPRSAALKVRRICIALNKPFGVLTQFSAAEGRATLADFVKVPDVYPAGRLDADSEGLVLLTNDGWLQHRLSDPRFEQTRTYWAQVEGALTEAALASLRRGVRIQGYMTKPCQVRGLEAEPKLWPRDPPVRFRKEIPTAWIELILTEGRNRQVRRMTAAVGLPTLRLVRVAHGPIRLGNLQPGEWREVSARELDV